MRVVWSKKILLLLFILFCLLKLWSKCDLLLTDCTYPVAHLHTLPVDTRLRLRTLGTDDALRLTSGGCPTVPTETGAHGHPTGSDETLGVGSTRVGITGVGG